MIFSLIAALFVLLVAGFWAFQGVFSSAIMLVETIVAVMVAFGFYEALPALWGESIPAEYGYSAALVALFVVTLVVLRVASDRWIPGNMHFPLAIDRAGGGLLGLLTGLSLIGTVLVAVQMLPLGRSPLGFDRYDPAKPHEARSLWLSPDGFAVGLVNLLSHGRFGGDGPSFETAHPGFLDELYALNAGYQREGRRDAPKGSLTVLHTWTATTIESVEQEPAAQGWRRNFSAVPPERGQYLVARVAVDRSAEEKVLDGQPSVCFTPAQFRIVGPPVRAGERGSPQSYLASGLSDIFSEKIGFEIPVERANRLVKWPLTMRFALNSANAKQLMENNRFVFDVVFEVPVGFRPWYVEFKSGAKAEVTEAVALKEPPPPRAAQTVAAAEEEAADEEEENEEETEAEAAPDEEETAAGDEDEADEDEDEDEEEAEVDEEEDENSEEEKEPATAQAARGPGKGVQVGEKPKGRVHLADAVEDRTGVFATLPLVLRRSDLAGATLRKGKLWEGHVAIESPPEKVPPREAVEEFLVPDGLVMVQVGAEPSFAGSIIGGALEAARRAANQIFIETESGKRYFAQGMYLSATVNGNLVFEVQYWPEDLVPERCLKEPKRLKRNVQRQAKDPTIGFLFLVEPGEKVIRFFTSPRSGQDVRIEVPS